MKQAFTLIELLMVIAIIGIVSTLAVNKVGGVREASARKVSVANQVAVERAVEAFLTNGGRLNRLDSLLYTQSDMTRPWDESPSQGTYGFNWTKTNYTFAAKGPYLGPTSDGTDGSAETYRTDYNAGLSHDAQAVLCPYRLSHAQRMALGTRLGLHHVMGHNDYAGDPAAEQSPYHGKPCGDGTYVESRNGKNPNESGCVAVAVTNVTHEMTLLAVNPTIEAGRAIYRACGTELMKTRRDGEQYEGTQAVAEVNAQGGPLIALGLGPSASIIGKSDAGLESAPYATYLPRLYYAHYLLLIRLRPVGGDVVPEFAGVIDPSGLTVRAAREIIRSL